MKKNLNDLCKMLDNDCKMFEKELDSINTNIKTLVERELTSVCLGRNITVLADYRTETQAKLELANKYKMLLDMVNKEN